MADETIYLDINAESENTTSGPLSIYLDINAENIAANRTTPQDVTAGIELTPTTALKDKIKVSVELGLTFDNSTDLDASAQIGISTEEAIRDVVNTSAIIGIDTATTIKDRISAECSLSISAAPSITHSTLLCNAVIGVSCEATPLNRLVSLTDFNLIQATVRRSVSDSMWELQADMKGETAPKEFSHVQLEAMDYSGVMRHIFSGIIVKTDRIKNSSGKAYTLTGYDYGWYLSAQYLAISDLTVNLDGTYDEWYKWIVHLLGETGLYIFNVRPSTAEATEFAYNPGTTKLQAIQDITSHCKHIFMTSWIKAGDTWHPIATWTHEDDITDPVIGLGITPEVLTPDDWIIEMPTLCDAPEEKINRVRIRGYDSAGNWYSKTLETPEVTAGEELPREYYNESSEWNTQTKVDAAVQEAYDYYTHPPWVISLTLYRRYDLQLHQLISFDGDWPDYILALTDGSLGYTHMRITEIEYKVNSATPYVTITAVSHGSFTFQSNQASTIYTDAISETEILVDNAISQQATAAVGTVTAVNGNLATVQTEDGRTITARIIT